MITDAMLSIFNNLSTMVINVFLLIVAPILFLVLITRKLVIDVKNKIVILNSNYKGDKNV
jgi:hypothetical protein